MDIYTHMIYKKKSHDKNRLKEFMATKSALSKMEDRKTK